MRFVVSCVKQTVIFALMAVLSVGFLFFVHFCHSATMSLASWPLTQQSYQNSVKETDRSTWKGVGYNDTSGLLWFLHITDLHISKFRSPERTRDLQQLCLFVKDSLRPKVVVVTGDLTDAKTVDNIGSDQYLEEWETYQSVWKNFCKIKSTTNKDDTIWLDIRGNHDTFNVKSDEADNNFFRRFGVQGPSRRRSYTKTVTLDGKWDYSFVGIDATLSPGPKRPFNFFGSLTGYQLSEVETLLAQTTSDKPTGLVTFGHYPLSTVVSPSPGVKDLVGHAQADVYLSGHLHNFLKLAPKLYAKQPEGYLDLELADWKDNRAFRVAAFDRGHLTFVDQAYVPEEPVVSVLITNPLDAQFLYGPKISRALEGMAESTHIRALVFPPPGSSEVEVEAIIDDSHSKLKMVRAKDGEPLFIARWTPSNYTDGKLHNITVTAIVKLPNHKPVTKSQSIQFTLNFEGLESLDDFGLLQRVVMMSNISVLLQAGLAVILAIIVLPMCALRLIHKFVLQGRLKRPRRPQHLFGRLFHQIVKSVWIVSNLDQLFYPVVLYLGMVALGPWGLGYFLDGELGLVFAWGMFVNGTWLPTYTTLIYTYWFLAPYWIIMLAGVAWTVGNNYDDIVELGGPVPAPSFCSYLCRHLWFIIVMVIQAFFCIEFFLAYGVLALFSIPGLFRLVAFYYLWSQAVSLQHRDFASSGITQVWNVQSNVDAKSS